MPWATTTERGSGMNPGIGRMTTGGRHRVSRWGAVLVPIFLILGTGVADAAVEVPIWGSRTARVSVSSLERQTNGPSYCCPAISKHGRHVAFQSDATNLVASDTNGQPDVFVRDRFTGMTERVSVTSRGDQSNGDSGFVTLSNSGRYVAFYSTASNLVARDTNDVPDVFVHDRATGTTRRVSVTSDGRQANGLSFDPNISGNGRYVAFISEASNLVAGDTNGLVDVFVRDLLKGTTRRVSISSAERQGNDISVGPVMSFTGRYTAFVSGATNLVPGDTNELFDVFLRDLKKGTTTRVNLNSAEQQAQGGSPFDTGFPESISRNGRFVSFDSLATNLVPRDTNDSFDVFVRDRWAGQTTRVSVDNAGRQLDANSLTGPMSDDGRVVVFWTLPDILVPGDPFRQENLFVRDRRRERTSLLSVGLGGAQANDSLGGSDVSADGRHIAFFSAASNLVRGDTNGETDIFVRDLAGH
jgi:Tol biopolymer transport system component